MSIEVSEVSKLYGSQKALNNVSFTVSKPEIVGFLGPNGAGKSTMMKILTTYIKASSGNIKVNSFDVDLQAKNVQKSVGYLPENNPLYLEMYIKEYLRFNAQIYKISNERVQEVIELTGLTPESHKKIGQLSKGYRQRVGLASALLHDPDVLILDEPTTGLDPNQLVDIRNLIKSIGKTKTVFLSTHIMQEVEAICDRVIIINKGQLVADNTAFELQHDHTHQTVYTEFEGNVSKGLLNKIPHVRKVEKVGEGWLLETTDDVDLRKEISRFAQKNNLLVLTLKAEEKSLEEVFKQLTK